MENEDELATVLGHEMTHVEDRHMLRYQRSAHNKEVGFTVAAIAAYVAVAAVAGDAADHGDWGEAEALDALRPGAGRPRAGARLPGVGQRLRPRPGGGGGPGGFAKLAAAGYDLRQAPKVYQVLYDDHGDSRRAEAFFFGSHPRLTERIEVTKRYVAAHAATRRRVATDRAERDGGLRPRHPAGGARRRPAQHRHGAADARRGRAPEGAGAGCPRTPRPIS